MKKRSLRSQYLVIIILTILITSTITSCVSVLGIREHVVEEAETTLSHLSQKESIHINALHKELANSVNIMEAYLQKQMENGASIAAAQEQASFTQAAEELFLSMAQLTDACETFYLRFNPETTTPTAGFFYGRQKNGCGFEQLATTDLSLYPADDMEHVGWYWEPVRNGAPLWMQPYYNQNYGIHMISYCVPVYCDGTLLGVAGMDYDLSALTSHVDAIQLYEHGYAYLAMDGKIIYHKALSPGSPEPAHAANVLQQRARLENGMELITLVERSDVQAVFRRLALRIVGVVLLWVLVVAAVAGYITQRHVHVFEKLTQASVKLASGDFDITFEESPVREIDQMNKAFQKMSTQLSLRDHQQQRMAFVDTLTGLRNANAYRNWAVEHEQEMQRRQIEFGMIVLDINNLKVTNDTYGHTAGDLLIIAAARLIAETFKHSPVYRTGGDEFIVVLQNGDLQNHAELLQRLVQAAGKTYFSEHVPKPVSIASGVALYRPGEDATVEAVQKRADAAMYENKQRMKKAPNTAC